MAKKYIIELETKADGTIGTLNEVTKGLESVASAEQKVAASTEDVTEQLAKLREQLQKTDVNSDKYKSLLDTYQKLGGSVDALLPKYKSLKEQQSALTKELAQGQVALGTDRYNELTAQLAALDKEIASVGTAVSSELNPALNQVNTSAQSTIDELGKLRQQLNTIDVNSEQYATLRAQYEALGGSLRELVPNTEALRAQQAQLQQTLAAGAQSLGADKYAELSQELALVNNQLAQTSSTITEATAPLSALQAQTQKTTSELASLESQLANVDPNTAQYETLLNQYNALSASLSTVTPQLQSLQEEQRNLTQALSAGKDAIGVERYQELSAQLDVVNTELTALGGTITGNVAQPLTTLEGSASTVTQELAQLKSQLQGIDVNSAQYAELSAAYTKLGGNLSELIPATDQLQKEQVDLQATLAKGRDSIGAEKYDALTQRLTEVNTELNQLSQSASKTSGPLEQVKNSTASVEEELKRLSEQLKITDVGSDQYKELTAQYEKLGGKIGDLIPKTQNLKQEQRELKKALLAGQEALGVEKYTQLTQRLGEVNDQLKDIAESAGQNAGPPLENLKNISGGLTERLKNLDFEGLSQDVRNFAGNIKNVSFKGFIDGIKGLGGAFSSLGKALLSNPIFLVAAAIVSIGLAVKSFFDSQREDVDAFNASVDKNTEKRKDQERLLYAQAAGNNQKLTQLKIQSNAQDLKDTQAKINKLIEQDRRAYGLSEEQEKQLSDLRAKYRQQQIDGEIIKVEAINALNAKRLSLNEEFELRNLDERQKQEALLTREYKKQEEELRRLGGSVEDFDKLGEIFADKLKTLRDGFAATDKAAAQTAADKAKATADAIKQQQQAVNEAIKAAQDELASKTRTDQENELFAVSEKYRKLKEQAEKAKVDTAQIVELQGKEEAAIREKYAKIQAKIVEDAKAEQLATVEALVEENANLQRSAQQRELDAIGEVYFEKVETLKAAGKDATAIQAEWDAKRQEIIDKYAQEQVDKEKERQQAVLAAQNAGLTARQQALNNDLAALKADYDARIALAKKYGQDVTALEQEYQSAQKTIRVKAALETAAQWADAASQAADALASITEQKATELGERLTSLDKQIGEARTSTQRAELVKQRKALEQEAKRAFEKNKKAQIAAAIVNTAASAISAFGSQLVVGDPTSIIRASLAAAAAGVAGALQISKIKQTQFESSAPPASSNIPDIGGGAGGGGATAASAGEATTPGFNPLVLDFLNNRPEQQMPRAYVLAGDVEKATQARDRVEELARL